MRDFDLRELQLKELEILVEIDRVCKKYDIQYYLAYGTLLGAIRHQGFIPWDDDIDLMMHVKDLIKFKQACKEEYGENGKYFFQDIFSEENYYVPFAKFRDSNSTYIIREMIDYPINWGISIDIFPLVPVKKMNGTFRENLIFKIMNLCITKRLNALGFGHYVLETKKMKYVPSSICMWLGRKMWTLLHKVDTNAPYYMEISNGMKNSIYCYHSDDVKDTVMKTFENQEFPVMNGWDNCLKNAYGDYMVIPDVEQRIDHGDIIVDLNTSYTEYTKSDHLKDNL